MANYSTLKAAVADVVKTNGTQAITGANLQAVLLSIINSVGGGGYIFKGVATPSTDAGTPDENVAYIGGAGTYANFGTSVTVPAGSIGVFKYNGSWTKEQIALFAGIDDVPTAGSDNLVKSGGVATIDADKVDISVHKNLYNKASSTIGFYINSNGGLSSNASFFVSDFIPVKPSTDYYITRGTTDGSVGSAASYYAEYDSNLNKIGVIVATTKSITTSATTHYLRISGFSAYQNSAMISEGNSFTLFEEYSPINYPIFIDQFKETDFASILSTPNFYKEFVGANMTIATQKIYLGAGRKYRLMFSDTNWSVQNLNNSANKLIISKYVGTSATTILSYIKSATIPNIIDITADNADYYQMDVRADIGTTVKIYVEDITSIYELGKTLPQRLLYDGADTFIVRKSLNTIIGHTYRIYFCQRNWSWENIGSGNYFICEETGGNVIFAYNKVYYPDGFQYRDFIAETSSYDICIRADVGTTVELLFADITNIFDNSIISFNGDFSNLYAELYTLKRPSYGSNSPSRFTLLFYSDIHNGIKNNKRIRDFQLTYNMVIDDVIHGGDSVYDKFTDDNTVATYGGQSFLNVVGNHDVLLDGGGIATGKQYYDKFIAPNISEWGNVVFPTGASTNGYCYYYKDYTSANVRIIALDCMHWDETQLLWLQDTLADAATNGISVIAVSHYCPDRFPTFIKSCTFCSLYSEDVNAALNSEAVEAVATAMEDTTHPLDFICWLFGHTHRDYFVKVTDYPNQYAIGVDRGYGGIVGDDSIRDEGTRYYDSFDIISVDTKAKYLSVLKMGVNADRLMRQKNYLVFDYANRVIINNS